MVTCALAGAGVVAGCECEAAGADTEIEVRSSVIGASAKLRHIWHEMYVDDRLRATEEVLGVHVDTAAGRSSPFPDEVARRVGEALAAPPAEAGRAIRSPHP
jgi:acyl-CoA thioester hydrolase